MEGHPVQRMGSFQRSTSNQLKQWEQHRRRARAQEAELDGKLAALAQICAQRHQGGRQTHESALDALSSAASASTSMTAEISRLLLSLSEVHNAMAEVVHTGDTRSQMLARHRDIFQEYTNEFKRLNNSMTQVHVKPHVPVQLQQSRWSEPDGIMPSASRHYKGDMDSPAHPSLLPSTSLPALPLSLSPAPLLRDRSAMAASGALFGLESSSSEQGGAVRVVVEPRSSPFIPSAQASKAPSAGVCSCFGSICVGFTRRRKGREIILIGLMFLLCVAVVMLYFLHP